MNELFQANRHEALVAIAGPAPDGLTIWGEISDVRLADKIAREQTKGQVGGAAWQLYTDSVARERQTAIRRASHGEKRGRRKVTEEAVQDPYRLHPMYGPLSIGQPRTD